MTEPEYDEATCITAGELRSRGIAVGQEVPDCGWVRRDSIRMGVDGKATRSADGRIGVTIVVEFTEPFRYVRIAIEQTA